jgi:hypothetical protein
VNYNCKCVFVTDITEHEMKEKQETRKKNKMPPIAVAKGWKKHDNAAAWHVDENN